MPNDFAFQTLAISIFGGAFITVLARKWQFPTIVLLFAGGALLGPSGLGLVQPDSLGDILPAIVALSIGIILFEGGLTLDPRDYLRSPRIIKYLLTVGALVTWVVSAAAVKISFDASWQMSLLAGSLVIVTGPTVVIPLLRRLRLQPRLSSILHWEGVMIDAIGVFLAVLCYELVVLADPTTALLGFAGRLVVGGVIGVAGGFALQKTLERGWIPETLTNPFVLASAVCIFTLAETALHEAGLLAVTLAGIVVGRRRSADVRQILTFKAELSDLLIGALFILLVGRLDLKAFIAGGLPLAVAVMLVMLVARPLNVWLSSIGSGLEMREKLFLAWVAPRGIVAASMASLFSLQLSEDLRFAQEAALLETFTFSVIAATVVLQGLSAGWLAKRLGVSQAKPKGWLIIGAHLFGRELARALTKAGGKAFLVDNNPRNISTAQAEGLEAMHGDARDVDGLREHDDFPNVGYALALTDNSDLNATLAQLWRPALGKNHVFAWHGAAETDPYKFKEAPNPFALLPRPSIVSEELHNDSAQLHFSAGATSGSGIPLFRKVGESFVPATPGKSDETEQISLVRHGGHLGRALAKGGELSISPDSLEDLYRILCDTAASRDPRLEPDALLADLHALEQVLTPVLGHGLVMPHAYSREITERLCFHARVDPPLEIEGGDEPITHAYFIISPSGDPQGHLATLAEIARHHR